MIIWEDEHGKKLMPYKQPEVDIEEDKTADGSNWDEKKKL
jgi:hypothetical protein